MRSFQQLSLVLRAFAALLLFGACQASDDGAAGGSPTDDATRAAAVRAAPEAGAEMDLATVQWIPADCPSQGWIYTKTDYRNGKRRTSSAGRHEHELLIQADLESTVTIRTTGGQRRGLEIDVDDAGELPSGTPWAYVSLDAFGCDIAAGTPVGVLKDGVYVPGSRYDAQLERAIAPVIGNSSYIIATPGDEILSPTPPADSL